MISSRCYYALKAVLELARREGSGPVSISQVAREQGIPARFLEAILRQLKQAGITNSARGKTGGYFLAKPADSIRVGTVIRLLEGPLVSVGSRSSEERVVNDDVFTPIWEEAEAALSSVYDEISFATLVERDRIRKDSGAVNYAI